MFVFLIASSGSSQLARDLPGKALSGATPLASPDTTEALVGPVSRDRIPSGHIPLILLVFLQGVL